MLVQLMNYLLLFREHTAAVQWFFTIVQRYILQQFSDFRNCSEINTAAVPWFFTIVQVTNYRSSVIFHHCSGIKTAAISKHFFYDNSLWNAITIFYEPRNNWELTIKRYVWNVTGIFQEYNSDTQQQQKQCSISAKGKDNYVHSMTRITL